MCSLVVRVTLLRRLRKLLEYLVACGEVANLFVKPRPFWKALIARLFLIVASCMRPSITAATSGLWSLALFMAAMTAKWSLNSRLTADGVVRGFMLLWRRKAMVFPSAEHFSEGLGSGAGGGIVSKSTRKESYRLSSTG